MTLDNRIKSLAEWGATVASISEAERNKVFQSAGGKNGWFTESNCQTALLSILTWLDYEKLKKWTDQYSLSNKPTGKTVGLIMAGNIPLVGFHDLLCVLITGHSAKIKLSSQDEVLLPYLLNKLILLDTLWSDHFSLEDRLNKVNSVIATGSDNSSRYFEYYFRDIPKILRKNRTSVGIILGEEQTDELTAMGTDVFSYFGLGCRNVSKIYVPDDFDISRLILAFKNFKPIINHNKYGNNFDYQRAIRLISSKKFYDGEFVLLENSSELVSPISVLYYEHYSSQSHLTELLSLKEGKLQCIVSAKGWYKGSIPFGAAQTPKLDDYADGVDTLSFLASL